MRDSFPITPGSGGAMWSILVLALLMGGLVAMFGWFAWSAKNTRFEVTSDALSVVGAMYGRSIPIDQVDTENLKIVNMRKDRDYALTIRTNGVGLPGYLAGWFRTQGRGKALAFVTDVTSVVYIPTRLGYCVLLSTPDPERLIGSIRRAHG